MPTNELLQELLERIQEDERLRGDLEDQAAQALVAWVVRQTEQLSAIDVTDEDLETHAKTIRMAARSAARSGEQQPQQVLERAETSLREADPALTERLALRKELFSGLVSRETAPLRAAADPATTGSPVSEADLASAPAGPPVAQRLSDARPDAASVFQDPAVAPAARGIAAVIQRLASDLSSLITNAAGSKHEQEK